LKGDLFVLEHLTPKVIPFYAYSASHKNSERSPCTETDKFSVWVSFANNMAVFLTLTIQWIEQALTSLITWMIVSAHLWNTFSWTIGVHQQCFCKVSLKKKRS